MIRPQKRQLPSSLCSVPKQPHKDFGVETFCFVFRRGWSRDFAAALFFGAVIVTRDASLLDSSLTGEDCPSFESEIAGEDVFLSVLSVAVLWGKVDWFGAMASLCTVGCEESWSTVPRGVLRFCFCLFFFWDFCCGLKYGILSSESGMWMGSSSRDFGARRLASWYFLENWGMTGLFGPSKH